MVMERKGAPGDYKGHIRCILQVTENVNGEATVEVNNHFILADKEGLANGSDVYKVIENLWDEVLEDSRALLVRVQEVANAA